MTDSSPKRPSAKPSEATSGRVDQVRPSMDSTDDSLREKDVFGDDTEVNYHAVGGLGAIVLMLKTQIGLGVLTLPHVVSVLGLVPGIIALLGIGTLTTWSDWMVGRFKLRHRAVCESPALCPPVTKLTQPDGIDDVGKMLFGRVGEWVASAVYWLYMIFVTGSAMLSISIALNSVSAHGACTAVFVAVAAIASALFASIQTLGKVQALGWIGVVSILAAGTCNTSSTQQTDPSPDSDYLGRRAGSSPSGALDRSVDERSSDHRKPDFCGGKQRLELYRFRLRRHALFLFYYRGDERP